MGDYLEAYAARFDLEVRTGVYVDRVYRDDDAYVVESGLASWKAENVIVASGAHRIPKVPGFVAELEPGITQLHSADYRNPGQLRDGGVLVVGVGNSGAEIAYELSSTHRVWQAGSPAGEIPVPHGSFRARLVLPVLRFLGTRVLTNGTPVGRKVGPKLAAMATPLIRIKSTHLAAAGVETVPRVAGVRDGLPLLEDGRVLEVENVVWCTGFRHELSWIDVPAFGVGGQPLHERGVVPSAPGLYFVGLVFQHAVTSDVIPGVGRDAAYVAAHLAKKAREAGRVRAPRGAQALELT
jgi:putative flavoprotein involved in K+ transport